MLSRQEPHHSFMLPPAIPSAPGSTVASVRCSSGTICFRGPFLLYKSFERVDMKEIIFLATSGYLPTAERGNKVVIE